ncbi:dihydrodipicolinate synthase family protein [Burkholderia sp. S171]|uniref:dihydrodipicolinate synthase family protein n=1 Tax=Burkholderia sp. S171 TaxID=1641860 RepID=UPI00131E8CF3|nr:dihydrodipicolinate synthase family protein [Burkholderia sp. S171]
MTIIKDRLAGTLAPVLTPFKSGGSPCTRRFIEHCERLLEQDVGIVLFGTNSEAASMTVREKRMLLDALREAAGLPRRMMVGVGSCALAETVELTRAALDSGCYNVLMLPPFFYKGVSDEGLFRSVAQVIESVGDTRLRIYLYHIPAVSQVPFSVSLIGRLLNAYPNAIAGIKDSSGDPVHTLDLISEFRGHGFDVFAGNETHLVDVMLAGAAGVISATANVNGAAIARLCKEWNAPGALAEQAGVNHVRSAFSKFPIIAAMKTVIAARLGDAIWAQVRAPLIELDSGQKDALLSELITTGYESHHEQLS